MSLVARPLLFDLREADLARARERYAPRAPLDALAALLSAPFQVEHFGDLGSEVGAAAAERLIAALWDRVRQGLPAEELAARFAAELEAAADAAELEEPKGRLPLL